jgi:hypothetical protein
MEHHPPNEAQNFQLLMSPDALMLSTRVPNNHHLLLVMYLNRTQADHSSSTPQLVQVQILLV